MPLPMACSTTWRSSDVRESATAANAPTDQLRDADRDRREVRESSVSGDPDGEGIVWPRVAELSLLGALSCGGWLLQLVLDGLETEQSPYRCAVAATHTHATPCV